MTGKAAASAPNTETPAVADTGNAPVANDGATENDAAESTGEDDTSWRTRIESEIAELRQNFSQNVAREQTATRQAEPVTIIMPQRSERNHSATESTTQPDQNHAPQATEQAETSAAGNGEPPKPRPYVGGVLGRRRNHPPSAD